MYLLEHLKDLSMGVHSIQVIQKTLSELEIKFVPDDSLKDRALDIIRGYFQDALGDDIEVKFTRVVRFLVNLLASYALLSVLCKIRRKHVWHLRNCL